MSGDGCVEKACGQILFCLKMSNLNYMVKETPYSAYVTIRKKFTKVSNVETPPSIKVNESNEKLRKEHNLLEQKCKALYSENGHLKISNEKQGPHVFSFTLLDMLGTMNLIALLP